MMLRVLVLSTVFPNRAQPSFGVFVRERTRRVAERCEVVVVAPVPWFPFDGRIRGRHLAAIPPVERQGPLIVYHPRVFSVPRVLKPLDGVFYAASLVLFLRRLRKTFPFDLIDAHFVYPDGFAAVVLGALFRRPVVITLRGSIVRLATYAAHRPMIRYALRRAARILAVSESLGRVAAGLGIDPGRMRVIPNGVDTSTFAVRGREEARRALGLPPGRRLLLSVGGLNEGKGHHRVVGQLPRLLDRHPDLLYVIVGGERPGDSVRARLEELIGAGKLEDHVRLAGERPHDEIPLWLAAADVFCLATRSEGWANVLLEAMACGVPVVTTRVGGNPEIVARADLGTLVAPDDDEALGTAILEALERSWDRSALVEHARRHSWDVAAAEVIEAFQAAVAGAGRAELVTRTVESRR